MAETTAPSASRRLWPGSCSCSDVSSAVAASLGASQAWRDGSHRSSRMSATRPCWASTSRAVPAALAAASAVAAYKKTPVFPAVTETFHLRGCAAGHNRNQRKPASRKTTGHRRSGSLARMCRTGESGMLMRYFARTNIATGQLDATGPVVRTCGLLELVKAFGLVLVAVAENPL
jgi:hypothetical protein